jgi:hypothetical protein
LFTKAEDADWTKSRLRIEALRAIEHLLKVAPDFRQLRPPCVPPAQADQTWQAYLKDQQLREAKWDAATQSFR